MEDLTQTLMAKMLEGLPKGMMIPPPIFTEVGGRLTHFENNTLVARFPTLERWANPMGHMQGGMIATILDCTLGPLAFLVAPPSATSTMTINFIRPVLGSYDYVEVTAKVVDRTMRQLILSAEVTNPQGKLMATAQAIAVIVGAKV